LAGIPLLSDRMVRDSRVDLQSEVQRVMRDFFSLRLDDSLLHGDGASPNPKGVFSFALDAAAGGSPWEAVTNAKGEIVAAGGKPHLSRSTW
jgi:HK97 family phage major capsid protein